MLQITIPERELWDEQNAIFIKVKGVTIAMEHSLVSLSKWEAKWHKPFINKEEKTKAEIIDYMRCMTLTQNIDPIIYEYITQDNIQQVNDYISDSMSATWFSDNKGEGKQGNKTGEQITSELIYYWMVAYQIPFECQKWHLNRLLTLIRICDIKNKPPKKYSKKDIMRNNTALNAARRQRLGTNG